MSKRIEVRAPESSQEGTESMVGEWLKQLGERVEEHEPLLEISTDKVNLEVSAPASGRLSEILKQAGDPVGPGDLLGWIEAEAAEKPSTGAAASPVRKPSAEAPVQSPLQAGAVMKHRLSPAVRRLIQQHGLDPSRITGSGRGGRITFQDAEAYLGSRQAPAASPVPQPAPPPGETRRVAHTPMRRSIAAHMVESLLHTAPHVTAFFEADLSAVLAHRQAHRREFEQEGVRLTLTAYFVSAAVRALQAVPEVNSRWHDDYLELLPDFNIEVAAAVQGGLVVPVVRRAQGLSLFETASQIQQLTEKARSGKLQNEDLQEGTFTITNHGVSGSLIATPIIHQPQSAILGIGKLQKRVVVEELRGADAIVIRPMAYITLTIDHRALDGYQANTFLSKFVEELEGWSVQNHHSSRTRSRA